METRASARPGGRDDPVDSQLHQRRLLDKREPRQSAASPIAITTFIADFTKLLIGDLTGTRKTRVSLFPPSNVERPFYVRLGVPQTWNGAFYVRLGGPRT